MVPKFTLINRILNQVNLSDYEYLVICDDDIALPSQFLDNYLALVGQYHFAIAQPARTNDSYVDHQFVRQLHGIKARLTRFVEIGPVFSFHKKAFAAFMPFDEESPMGWGYDFVWPHLADKNGLNMGIVDATPVTGHQQIECLKVAALAAGDQFGISRTFDRRLIGSDGVGWCVVPDVGIGCLS